LFHGANLSNLRKVNAQTNDGFRVSTPQPLKDATNRTRLQA
jgi:hypothetical protein